MTSKKDIGLAIKILRKKAAIKTQEKLGKMLNPNPVGKDTITRIENGYGNYGIDTLFKIAEVLNCDVSVFFESKKPSRISMFEGVLEDFSRRVIEEEKAKYKK